jgi:hypothetical protein
MLSRASFAATVVFVLAISACVVFGDTADKAPSTSLQKPLAPPKQNPFMTDWAREPVNLTRADWALLQQVIKDNCEGYVTDDIIKTSLWAEWFNADTCLIIRVDTKPQPRFESHYLGKGNFDVDREDLRRIFTTAAWAIQIRYAMICALYVERSDSDKILVEMSMRGSLIGSLYNNKFRFRE